MAGEDDLIADLDAHLEFGAAEGGGQGEALGAGAGPEVSVSGDEAGEADRLEEGAHGEIFAIGDEMRLVIAAEQLCLRERR